MTYVWCFYKKKFLDFAGKDDNTTRTIIIVVSSLGSVIVFVVCACIFLRKRKQKRNPKQKVQGKLKIVYLDPSLVEFGLDPFTTVEITYSLKNKEKLVNYFS